jgi:hypothetical protein
MHPKVGQASRLPSAYTSRRVVEEPFAESLFGDPPAKEALVPQPLRARGRRDACPTFVTAKSIFGCEADILSAGSGGILPHEAGSESMNHPPCLARSRNTMWDGLPTGV